MKIKIPVNNENLFRSAIAVLALVFLFTGIWSFVRTNPGVDYYISWIGVMSVREQKCVNFYETEKGVQIRESFHRRSLGKGVPQRQKTVAQCWQDYEKIFYSDQSPKNRLPFFFNTPFLYTCMHLFIAGDYERDITLYYLIQLACFILFIMIAMHLLNFSFVSIFYPAILFSVFYGPFLCNMTVGNVVLMQLAFIALFLVFAHLVRKKDIGLLTGGAVLGLMVFFKPTMIFVPFMLLLRWLALKQFRQAALSFAGMMVGAIAAILSAAMFFSTFHVWLWWFKSACDVSDLPYVTVKEGNYALPKVLEEMYGMKNLSFAFSVISLAVIIATAYSIRKKIPTTDPSAQPASPQAETLLMISIGCLLYLLCAPLVWIHYYMLVLPAFMYLARPNAVNTGFTAGIIYSLTLMAYCSISFAGRPSGLSPVASAIACNIGIICLISCLLWSWHSGYSNKTAQQ